MNADAILMAMKVNIGDPKEMQLKAETMVVPGADRVPSRTLEGLKKKYGLLGQVSAYKKFSEFLIRLESEMRAEEARNKAESEANKDEEADDIAAMSTEGPVQEDQYKASGGFHRRNQSMYPSSFSPSKSFGGVDQNLRKKKKKVTKKEGIEAKLDEILETLSEELSVRGDKSFLMGEEGKLIVDGVTAIDNHADILKVLVMWMMDHRPQVMHSAVDGVGDMVRNGTLFK